MSPHPTGLPLAEVTDEQIRSSDLIHVIDPSDLGFQAWIPIRPAASWGGPGSPDGSPLVLRVEADSNQAATLLANLRFRIWLLMNAPIQAING